MRRSVGSGGVVGLIDHAAEQLLLREVGGAYQELVAVVAEIDELREIVVGLAIHLRDGLGTHVIDADNLAALHLRPTALQFLGEEVVIDGVPRRAVPEAHADGLGEQHREDIAGDDGLATSAVADTHQPLALIVAEPVGHMVVLRQPLRRRTDSIGQSAHQQVGSLLHRRCGVGIEPPAHLRVALEATAAAVLTDHVSHPCRAVALRLGGFYLGPLALVVRRRLAQQLFLLWG